MITVNKRDVTIISCILFFVVLSPKYFEFFVSFTGKYTFPFHPIDGVWMYYDDLIVDACDHLRVISLACILSIVYPMKVWNINLWHLYIVFFVFMLLDFLLRYNQTEYFREVFGIVLVLLQVKYIYNNDRI